MDRKMDCDKLQIQGFKRNLDQLCHVQARLFLLRVMNLHSSKHYFKPLVTEACSDAGDAENSEPWNLPHAIMITSSSESELACFVFLFLRVA